MENQKKSPFLIENLAEDSGFLMLLVSNLWASCQDKALRNFYDISHMQFSVLASVNWQVIHCEKEVTQAIIARHIKVTPVTISQMLKVLEAKGYVSRKVNSTNVRAKSVELTPKGEELMIMAMKTIYDVNAKFFGILGKNIKHFNCYMSELVLGNDYVNTGIF